MSESRLVRAVVLTMITYGCISFLQWGKFLVPLPAFELAILGLCLYFALQSWKSSKISSTLFILFGVSQFLGRSYNYEFFLSNEQLYALTDTPIIDLFYLASFVLLGMLLIQQRLASKSKLLISILLAVSIVVCGLIPDNSNALNALPLIGIVSIFLYEKQLLKNHHSIWVLLLLFALSRALTLQLL